MTPFEALYGKSCMSFVYWHEVGIPTTNEAIQKSKVRMQTMQNGGKKVTAILGENICVGFYVIKLMVCKQ